MTLEAQGPAEVQEPMSDEQADQQFGAAAGDMVQPTTLEGVAAKENAGVQKQAQEAKDAEAVEKAKETPPPAPAKVEPVKSSKELAAEEVQKIEAEKTRVANEALSKRQAEEAKAAQVQAQSSKASAPPDMASLKEGLADTFKGMKFGANEGLAGFEKEYGTEITDFVLTAASALARKVSEDAVAPIARAESVREAEKQTSNLLNTLRTEYGHEDIGDIRQDPKFWAFVDGMDESIRKAVDNGHAKVISFVVNAFKEEAGLPTAKSGGKGKAEVQEGQRKKQGEVNDLHRNTSRSREKAPDLNRPEVESDEDAEAVFNEASKPKP
jgi:hypothetical protein